MMDLKPVLIRYYDHVEFRNKDYSQLKPMLREVLGWVVRETEGSLYVVAEKPVTKNLEEIADLKPTGFIILKSAVKEVVGIISP